MTDFAGEIAAFYGGKRATARARTLRTQGDRGPELVLATVWVLGARFTAMVHARDPNALSPRLAAPREPDLHDKG